VVLYHPDSERHEARARSRPGAEGIGPNKSAFDWSFAVIHTGLVTKPKLTGIGTGFGSIAVECSTLWRMTLGWTSLSTRYAFHHPSAIIGSTVDH